MKDRRSCPPGNSDLLPSTFSLLPSNNPVVLYRALQARDARFDGMFFVGVQTTGIYCRPVCRARTPRASSCRFFPVASAAEGAGFRPCLLCRPETAPGAGEDGSLERALLAHLRAGASAGKSVAALTASSGYSGRQLRRLLRERFGVGPVEIIQTERLLFAKRLLQETALPVIDVARSAGFGSLRRFNALFRGRYGLAPTGLRREKTTMTTTNPTDVLTLRLGFRPPLAWANLLRYFRRAVAGVEAVVPGVSYARTVNLDGHTGWLRVSRADDVALAVEVPAHLSAVLPEVLARVRRVFDLDANPAVIDEHLAGAGDPFMAACVARRPGLRVPGSWETFDLALRTILGQQISVAAATTLAGRVATRFGQPLTEPAPDGLTRLSPTARTLAAADPAELAALGLTKARAVAVVELAKSAEAGALRFPAGTTHDAAVESLKGLRGIGEWTAQYVALCALRFPDAFPEGDLGLRKALLPAGAPPMPVAELRARAERWRPWRAYAVMHLWESLPGNDL